ncbi:MAG TPA: ABC transporter substrate-binding protein [Candidatus Binatia bacterium]
MRKTLVLLAALLALGGIGIANAQQSGKISRIGFLCTTPIAAYAARIGAFRQGLRDLGYVEGKNIVIEYRSAEGKAGQLPGLAAELVRSNVDIIVSSGPTATPAAKQATSTIPIVMGFDSDPVGNGFVANLAHPGGNITGLSTLYPEISGKQLELLKEIVPRLSRVAVFWAAATSGDAQAKKEAEHAAAALGLHLQYLEVRNPVDVETGFQAATKDRDDAILALPVPIFISQRKLVTESARKSRIPAVYYAPEFVEDGGLMSYGVSIPDLFRRAASYVDRILKGARPGDLPVEQPTKFELVVNLTAAKQIGLAIPPNVLARADKVVK